MPRRRHLQAFTAIVILLAIIPPGWAEDAAAPSQQQNADIDSEHIFGFSEGSDIGKKGEREIESVTIGSFGKIGSYNNVDNETSFRYGVTDSLRLSIGMLSDYYNIHDVPGIADRSSVNISGIIGEARWNIVDRATHSFGMSLSFNPQWRAFDQNSGTTATNYALPVTLLIDKEFIPNQLFGAVNVIYEPAFERINGAWQHYDALTFIAATTYAIAPNTFFGAEIRHENLALNGDFVAHALYVGPSLYYRVSPALSAKVAAELQVRDLGATTLDLFNYQRHQVEFQLAYTF